jgi:hypothetical protein
VQYLDNECWPVTNYLTQYIGSETIAHVRENGRITVMLIAFEGPPRILRLFGTGSIFEFGTPEYERYLPGDQRTVGSRSVIVVDIYKVSSVSESSFAFLSRYHVS